MNKTDTGRSNFAGGSKDAAIVLSPLVEDAADGSFNLTPIDWKDPFGLNEHFGKPEWEVSGDTDPFLAVDTNDPAFDFSEFDFDFGEKELDRTPPHPPRRAPKWQHSLERNPKTQRNPKMTASRRT